MNTDKKTSRGLAVANNVLVLQNKQQEQYAEALIKANNDLRQVEEKLKKANRLYAFIGQVNQKIVRIKDEEALFRNACSIALEFGKFKMAWIGLFNKEYKKISLVEQSGVPPEYQRQFFEAPCAVDGPQYHVLRNGEYYMTNDIANELHLENWKHFADKFNLRSCIVIAIKKYGKIIGSFNLYATELNFFDKEEIALLLEVTGDISFAIDMFEDARKHKAMEALVTENKKKFRDTLDTMIEGIQIHDFDWRYKYVNDALVKYSHYTREELIGHTLMEKYPGIQKTDIFNAARRCMKDRVSEHLETQFIFPDGSSGDFELSMQPIPEGIFILSVDRTEQKKAESLLVQNEKKFRALIENSADMKTLATAEGVLFYASPSITRVLGYSTAHFLRIPVTEIIHPDDIGLVFEKIEEILKTPGSSCYSEHRLLHEDDSWVWCEGTITNMLHEPAVHALVSNFRDISEKKNSEQRLEFESKNLDALINNTHDLMWSVDRDFHLITSNKPFEEMSRVNFGKPLLKGDNVLSASYTPDMKQHFKQLYERAFAGEAFTQIEHFDQPIELWTEISYYPIRKGDAVIGTACHSRDITNIKKAEQQIISNEKRYRALVENGADAVAILSVEGKITYVSPSIEKMLGYTEQEVMKMDLFSIMHKDDAADVGKVWDQALASPGMPIPGHIGRMRHKNGTWRWFDATVTNMLHDPSINGIIDNFRDVTDKVNAAERIKKSETFNAGILNSLSSHIAVVDATGNILAVNETWKKFAHENRDTTLLSAVVGNNYFTLCSASASAGTIVSAQVLKGMQEVLTGKETVFYLEYLCSLRTEKIWFGMRVIKFDSDEPMIVIAHQNITERKLAEENLLKSEAKLKEAQAIAHTSNWEIDLLTNTSTWSDELYNIFGLKKEETVASTELFLSFIHPKQAVKARKNVKKTFTSLKDSEFHFQFIRNDGMLRYGYVERKFEFDRNNQPIRLYGILQDITERKIQNDAIEKQLKLEIKNKELEQFAYIASHDLQEPLRTVSNYIRVFREDYAGLLDEKARMYLKSVSDATERMSMLITSLLEFSRLGINKKLEHADCQQIIRDVIADLNIMIRSSDAHIEVTEMPELDVYVSELRQVFQNLIANAIKFRRKGVRVKIQIGARKINELWQFSIRDNGIGIMPVHFDRIFDIFQRLHTETEYEGNGIGLANCKKIILLHHGEIWVESNAPEEGTTFYFTIPKLTI